MANNSISKVIYIFVLVAILFLFLIYFDIIQNSSLFQIISVMLGFVLCLLIQFRIILHYFSKEIKEMNLNQFSIIKEKIQSIVFGELNPIYVDNKNKIKYYNHINDKKDRLFSEENEQTYQSVMAHLRAQNEIQHFNRIRGIRDKWESLQFKISLIERFLNSLYKVYKDRGTLFKNFYQKNTNKIGEQEYEKWSILFNDNNSYSPRKQMNEYVIGYNQNIVEWKQLSYLVQERMKMTFSKTKQISETVLKQFNLFSEEMRNRKKQKLDILHELDEQFSHRKRQHKEIVQNIEYTKRKRDEVVKTIKKNKVKSSQNVEIVFKSEYEFRTRNIQLENYEVKKTYTYDMCVKQSQILYKQCLEEQEYINISGIKSFNNKLLNYMNLMLEEEKRLHSKLTRHTAQNKLKITQDYKYIQIHENNIQQSISRYKELERRFQVFKYYIMEVLTLYSELDRNFSKTDQIIQDFHKQLLVGMKDSMENVNDRKFLNIIRSVNNKEKFIIEQTEEYINKQYHELIICEEMKRDSILKINQYMRGNGKSMRQSHDGNRLSVNVIHSLQTYYKIRMQSYLFKTLQTFLQGHYDIYRYIQQQTQSTSLMIQYEENNDDIDIREQKMNKYNDELFKIEMKEFESGPKRMKSTNEQQQQELNKQNHLRSLKILNKLLTVFFIQWSNSHFFHSVIKEQLEIALNRKRPPIVSYIHIKYLKLEEKNEDLLDIINLQGQQIFRCLFEAHINFKGKIAVHIETQIHLGKNKIPIHVKLLIKQFKCPLKICFTPYSLGKSYGSMMEIPKISIEHNVHLGKWNISKIPFISRIIETFIVIKLRKKNLWPKRFTISVPVAVKSPIDLAIRERTLYQKELEKKKNKMH